MMPVNARHGPSRQQSLQPRLVGCGSREACLELLMPNVRADGILTVGCWNTSLP